MTVPFKGSSMKVRVAVFLIWILAPSVSVSLADDLVKEETRVTDAVAKYGVTGNGVIVAVLDRGIDWQNNDFRSSDGSTRIAYMFDLTDDSGAKGAGNPWPL
jgi:subtilisin family serine protease